MPANHSFLNDLSQECFGQLPAAGHPMHLVPFFFSFIIYLMAKNTHAASAIQAIIVAGFITLSPFAIPFGILYNSSKLPFHLTNGELLFRITFDQPDLIVNTIISH